MDDLLNKGYGIASGMKLFIIANIFESIYWRSFSPYLISVPEEVDFEGIFPSLVYNLFSSGSFSTSISHVFKRRNLYNYGNICATFAIPYCFLLIRGFWKTIKIPSKTLIGGFINYKISLFYCSNTLIILSSSFVIHFYLVLQFLHSYLMQFFIFRTLGTWKENEIGVIVPTTGILYGITPPNTQFEFVKDPIHSILFVFYAISVSGLVARLLVNLSGKSVFDVCTALREKDYSLGNSTEDEEPVIDQLSKNIPLAATLQGVLMSTLIIIGDLTSVIGNGTGILLTIEALCEFYSYPDLNFKE